MKSIGQDPPRRRARLCDLFRRSFGDDSSALRAGIRAEVYLGNPKNFGNQMKYADRRGAPLAIIQGSDEAARGVVQVKDLDLGARIAAGASVAEWKGRAAQQEVPRDGLAQAIKAMLG